MEAEYVVEIQPDYVFGVDACCCGNIMGQLGQAVHNHKEGIVTRRASREAGYGV